MDTIECFKYCFQFEVAPLRPGSPLLGSLMEEWSGLFEGEVLPRMDPTSRAVLAQVNRAGRDAVRLSPADLACAGRTVGVKLKLVDFSGLSGGWLGLG